MNYKCFIVSVSTGGLHFDVEKVYADSWQSAILAHSKVGAEFEGIEDEFDLEARCQRYGYIIEWRPINA